MEDDDQPTLGFASDSGSTVVDELLGPGTDVGGYLIDDKIGHGGMGVVYGATHPVIGKRAAVKVLKPELSKDPAAVERFALEARAVNQIGHPNIVDIFAFGTLSDGRSYYVMDLLAGESLRARLKRSALHVSEAASVIDETASALMAAHDKGIIHRDLKPDNVFMVSIAGRWPEVKLLDWGLVKLVSPKPGSAKFRTVAGSVVGTPVYMSPEQARASETLDYRTDIYALGVMSFELLTGTVPFKKATSLDTMVSHQEDPVPSLLAKVPSLPDELVQLIEAMLAKDPDDRPTLAAARAVLKRLKGTKIPTMTAAGISMDLPPTTPMSADDEETIARPTIDEKLSGQSTEPRPPPGPVTLPLPAPPSSREGMYPPHVAYHAQSSVPPSAPFPSMSQAPLARPPALPPARSRRWIVIVTAAVVASTIGIIIALLV